MKNLTIKKIAFGILLAGYASSSAFALDAKTTSLISGNKPILTAQKDGAQDHTLTVRITSDEEGKNQIGNRAAKTGDYIVIKFNVSDADGDLDTGKIKDTLKVYIKKSTGAWSEITNLDSLKATNDGAKGQISFKIDNSFIGANYVGFKLLERTDYGLPYANQWLQVNDIWAKGSAPSVVDPIKPDDPENTPPEGLGPDPETEKHGPGDVTGDDGFGPIGSEKLRVGIFLVEGGAPNKAKNYANTSKPDLTLVPTYGDKFAAIVWEDNDGNGVVDANELEVTDSYQFEWRLDGEYEGVKAGGSSANSYTLPLTRGASSSKDLGNNDLYTLGALTPGAKHNSIYATRFKAGAQGFNLRVNTK
ncbi:hypothetical protein A9G41_00690 [Gilliamella sp. Nev5-1]|uniref:hypothetical protein n=1 Tax=Gilliamella sp. Nev5-1 TaxID=3120251 RepID=UPI000827C3EC|nr:hypothetical protein [Gilliamella apicola]OCG68364.1 hypothetical protein A9G41_00690 [Gilliamella apicola]